MRRNLDRLLRDYTAPPPGVRAIDFSAPPGAPALIAPDSVTWRVMKNPIALAVGGITAVILELAEPRVRTGVWEHTGFRRDPISRIRRTGYAAMVTVYAPADAARAMIAGVVRAHGRIEGQTPQGAPYRANDEELLNWVQATAGFGFLEAYRRLAHQLSPEQASAYFAEGAAAAALYGAHGAPRSLAEMDGLFASMKPKLERSDIVFEFLNIMRSAPLLPFKPIQHMIVRAAVDLTPGWARDILGLGPAFGARPGDILMLSAMARAAERFTLSQAPPAQACVRLGLPANYLYR